jgi:hypothetical protein
MFSKVVDTAGRKVSASGGPQPKVPLQLGRKGEHPEVNISPLDNIKRV